MKRAIRHLLAASLLTGAAVVSQPAGAAETITLTEVNDTTLTSSLPGVIITNLGPDRWEIDLGAAGITLFGTGLDTLPMSWKEEPGDSLVNLLTDIGDNRLLLESDVANTVTNNSCGPVPLDQGATCFVAADVANRILYLVTVIDRGDVPVPEPGTLALIGLGLAGLGYARRKRA